MPIPLIVPIAAGIVRAGVGMFSANREKQRRRGLIGQAYANSATRLRTRQANVREGTMEALSARGLLQGGQEDVGDATELNSAPGARLDAAVASTKGQGMIAGRRRQSAITNAMTSGALATPKSSPRSLAGQTRANTEKELGAEWADLDQVRSEQEAGISTQASQEVGASISAGVRTGVDVYNTGKALAGDAAPIGDYGQSSYPGGMFGKQSLIRSKMVGMSGVEDPDNWFGGIHGIDPLDAPGSSWNRKGAGTMIGHGEMNADFNIG